MKKTIATTCATFAITGCAVHPIALRDEPTTRLPVQYAKVVVEDLSVLTQGSVSDMVWVNGWVPIHNGFAPPLNESFVSRLKKSIAPAGPEGALTVSVVRVGLFMEKNYSDDMAFVNFFTSARERGFKCSADVSIKTDDDSRRMMLEHSIRRPYFDNAEQIGQFVETCHGELLKKIASATARP